MMVDFLIVSLGALLLSVSTLCIVVTVKLIRGDF